MHDEHPRWRRGVARVHRGDRVRHRATSPDDVKSLNTGRVAPLGPDAWLDRAAMTLVAHLALRVGPSLRVITIV